MISNQQLLKLLRDCGFKFKRPGKNVNIWKKPGSTIRIMVPKNKKHDPKFVEKLLEKARM